MVMLFNAHPIVNRCHCHLHPCNFRTQQTPMGSETAPELALAMFKLQLHKCPCVEKVETIIWGRLVLAGLLVLHFIFGKTL